MSFQMIPHPQRIQRTVRYEGPCELKATPGKYAAECTLPAADAPEQPSLVSLSGKDSGEPLPGLVIPPNKVAKLVLGTVSPSKAHILVTVNPALLEVASVNWAQILEPDAKQELALYIQARNQVDLSSFPWLIRIYAQGTA